MSEEENNANQQEKVVVLKAPHPLTNDNFDEILIRNYFDSMSNEEFVKVFHYEKTDENIERLLEDDKNFPQTFLRVVKQSMMETYKVMQDFTLEGETDVAWSMAENLAAFSAEELQYIHYKEGDDPNLKKYIRLRFSQIPSMFQTLNFIQTVEEANQISNSSLITTMKNAQKIYNQLRNYELNLNAEQKSSAYHQASEIFRRAQIVPGIYNEPKPCQDEILCLQMVLENTSLSDMVDRCLDRMSKDLKILQENIPLLITAYKRVLKNQHVIHPDDRYRLNSQIAELYCKKISSTCMSFSGMNIENRGNLLWAEYFYSQAAKKAPNYHKKNKALKAMSEIQKLLGEDEKAQAILIKAANLLPKPECYEQMLDIAAKEEKNAIQTIKQTIKKINRAKMPQQIKKILFDKALSITRLKTKDEKVISSVESLLPNKKLTPNNKVRGGSTHE